MSKSLTLMRHAKTLPDAIGQRDFDRMLSERGRLDARLIAEHLVANFGEPNRILCSSAVRTYETARAIIAACDTVPAIDFIDQLYLADHNTIMRTIAKMGKDAKDLLVIGHNPGMHEAALTLGVNEPTNLDILAEIAMKYPTGAYTRLNFEIDVWSQTNARAGHIIAFQTPKPLRESEFARATMN